MKKAVKGLIFGAVLGGVGILCAAVFSRFGTLISRTYASTLVS